MRVGVICEGPTDFYAIQHFFAASLKRVGVEAEFKALQPQMDQSQPEAGWGHVLLWLKKNPPNVRIQRYFGGGLFGGGLAVKPLDCLLIQLDSDILGEPSFSKFVLDNYQYCPGNPQDPSDRAEVICSVISKAGNFDDMVASDVARHIPAPAVESTETWCVAAFTMPTTNFEQLNGQALTDAFMSALETSESRQPQLPYANMDKTPNRRETFCAIHSTGSNRIIQGCAEFSRIHDKLVALSQ